MLACRLLAVHGLHVAPRRCSGTPRLIIRCCSGAEPVLSGPASIWGRLSSRLQPYTQYLVHGANLLLLLAVNQTDMLSMRLMMVTASSMAVGYNLLQTPKPLFAPACWGVFFISSHVYNIVLLLRAKQTVVLTEECERVYEDAFMRHGFTPRQFVELMDKAEAEWRTISQGGYVHRRGDPIVKANYLAEGEVQLINERGENMIRLTPGRGAWMGEFWDPKGTPESWQEERTHPIWYKCITPKCRTLAVDRRIVEGMIRADPNLKAAATKAELDDVWGKLHRHRLQPAENKYEGMLQMALSEGRLESKGRRVLEEYRERNGISDETHTQALENLGWTPAEFEAGILRRDDASSKKR